ncbi:unnamed protein product [Rotaria sp. Silwood2]|nr:unnamed protein product [Rotaria sp. Silwood2]CAF4032901.1 unnamed protein product [Rotaria sp. Silwood2]
MITNNFPDGLFKYVREVTLFDECSFEHEFFIRIVQSFPFVKKFNLITKKSPNDQQYYKSINENQYMSIIEYSYFTELYI